jgi:O-antigen/teichoic acid export membrane protein
MYLGEMVQFLTYRFDMWVVDAWGGVANLGRYSLAVTLAQLVWIVPGAAARVLFPYTAQMGKGEAAVLAFRTARICLLLSTGAALLGYTCAKLLLTTLFGEDFAQVPHLLGVLLLGVVPYSVSKVLGNYLAGINAVGTNLLANLAGMVITLALDLALIPKYGALGAAWATALSYTAYTVLLFCIFVRRSGLSLRAIIAPALPPAGSPEQEAP